MTIKVIKGSDSLMLKKGRLYPVIDVCHMGAESGHQVMIVIQKQDRRQEWVQRAT